MWLTNQSGRITRAAANGEGLVAALGCFDGVHLGHQLILRRTAELAGIQKLKSALISFNPHPAKFLSAVKPPQIFSFRQKILRVAECGISDIITVHFNAELANMRAEEFVTQYLFNKFNVKTLVIGPFASVGRQREGSPDWLKHYFNEHDRQVEIAEVSDTDGQRISSGRIRQALSVSDFDLAAKLLGRRFAVCARVREGLHLGRQLGFRTANLDIGQYVKPQYGVYSGFAVVAGKRYRAAINFGRRPTVSAENGQHRAQEVLEAHLLDYCGDDFYGQLLEVEFTEKIRQEIKFQSAEELKNQICRDVQTVRSCLE